MENKFNYVSIQNNGSCQILLLDFKSIKKNLGKCFNCQ